MAHEVWKHQHSHYLCEVNQRNARNEAPHLLCLYVSCDFKNDSEQTKSKKKSRPLQQINK